MPAHLENSVHQSDSESDEDYVPPQDDKGIQANTILLAALIEVVVLQTLIPNNRAKKKQI
jgi:hypothetical protein